MNKKLKVYPHVTLFEFRGIPRNVYNLLLVITCGIPFQSFKFSFPSPKINIAISLRQKILKCYFRP